MTYLQEFFLSDPLPEDCEGWVRYDANGPVIYLTEDGVVIEKDGRLPIKLVRIEPKTLEKLAKVLADVFLEQPDPEYSARYPHHGDLCNLVIYNNINGHALEFFDEKRTIS